MSQKPATIHISIRKISILQCEHNFSHRIIVTQSQSAIVHIAHKNITTYVINGGERQKYNLEKQYETILHIHSTMTRF